METPALMRAFPFYAYCHCLTKVRLVKRHTQKKLLPEILFSHSTRREQHLLKTTLPNYRYSHLFHIALQPLFHTL